MKKLFLTLAVFIPFFITSCVSLQEDVFVSSNQKFEFYQSIRNYEEEFLYIDSNFYVSGNASIQDINNLILEINQYEESKIIEPAVKARLYALEGLLYLTSGKANKAKSFYNVAKKAQAGDSYVLLLSAMLEKTLNDQLEKFNELLKIEENNAILILGKAKILYKLQNYNEAVAAIDNAFVIFEQNGNDYFIDAYTDLKDKIWELYTITTNSSSTKAIDSNMIQGNLTKESMIQLTLDHTSLLDFFTVDKKMKVSELLKKLEAGGYLSSAYDISNTAKSSLEITQSTALTRKLCARFIWNLFVQKKGNQSLRTKYSARFLKLQNPATPVPDVMITDKDFDAVLGTVENEIMELPDGRNFNPDEKVSNVDFLKWIQAAN